MNSMSNLCITLDFNIAELEGEELKYYICCASISGIARSSEGLKKRHIKKKNFGNSQTTPFTNNKIHDFIKNKFNNGLDSKVKSMFIEAIDEDPSDA